MRIVQLIDSLEAGGAERMAVQYANGLAETIAFSGLVATRKGGILKTQIKEQVAYSCLFKKSSLDVYAILKLRKFVKLNRVNIIHAHSSSSFTAVMLKFFMPKIKIIWHDHYGNSDFLEDRPTKALRISSYFFSGIIAVNDNLKKWSQSKLHFKNAIYLHNFATSEKGIALATFLKGEDGKRIVCLANLRPQKNHLFLLQVAERLKSEYPEWTFHLVGKDFRDGYSSTIKDFILHKSLEDHVFLYGSCSDVEWILEQAEIAVLSSSSEGLPVALLEYGLNKKPVVVTNVGQISAVVTDEISGFLVPSGNIELFFNSLVALINDQLLRERLATNLFQKVEKEFSAGSVIQKYIQWVKATITDE
ncbi:glycosyltransferase [Flavobacterium sp. TAB 87]|uniref:glycosyltransferase n=1 Tax=Flavobacterium sp. TAB 87 TaxID=1729581 RepID=UPI00076C3758|nr:glycosyltransferase [Flavobacterium sp. TAB 87]KVV15894.1 putative glycosyltransferase EpsD [Flavobacterium sp. TAB 87]